MCGFSDGGMWEDPHAFDTGRGYGFEESTRDQMMTQTTEVLTYSVRGVSCGHCRAAITAEVEKLAGVASVDVDLDAKRVSVAGDRLDDAAIRAAIDEAGYEVGY